MAWEVSRCEAEVLSWESVRDGERGGDLKVVKPLAVGNGQVYKLHAMMGRVVSAMH